MIGQRKPGRNAPCKQFKPPRGHKSQSLPVCLSTHTLFPSNKHFTCFNTFPIFVGTLFCKARRPGPCHWPLVQQPGFSTLNFCSPTSVSGWEQKLCFKLLQAKDTCRKERRKEGRKEGRINQSLTQKSFVCVLSRFSLVLIFATLWTVACQTPLSMGFSRQEY